MATTGQVYPTSGTSASVSPHSDDNWNGQGNIYTQNATSGSDTTHCAYVTAATFDNGDQTYILYAKGFDFSAITDGSVINGVTCRLGAFYTSGQGSGSLDLLQLLDTSGALAGTNQASTAVPLTTTYTTVITKGSSSDKWGLSLTPAWVRDPDFGVGIGMIATAANADVFADFVSLEIDYLPGTLAGAVTAEGTGAAYAATGYALSAAAAQPWLLSASPAMHRAETW